MSQAAVTVLMPVYNAEPFLREAIDSILNQTFTDFEFVIINDGSSDRSEEIIKSYTDPRIRYYKNEQNLKLIATLNKGIDLVSTPYIARMDADDISLPARLQLQYELMELHPEIGLCGTWYESFNDDKVLGVVPYGPEHATICFKHLFQIHLSHGTGMFRTSVLKEHGLYFNPDFSHAEDYELWSRISTVTRLANIQQVLYRVRHHENEVSKKYSDVQQANSYRVKAHLFKLIGVDVTREEMDIFQSLSYHRYEHSDKFLHGATVLLEKMMHARGYEMFFNKSFYETKLAEYWFNLHYNTTPFSGLTAFNKYHASPLSSLKPVALSTNAKFILKGLLKK